MYNRDSDKERSFLNKDIRGIIFHEVSIVCSHSKTW